MNIKTCDICGATEHEIVINHHKITGCLNDNCQTKIVNMCLCCEAWGMLDDEDKLLEITGLDEICWKE